MRCIEPGVLPESEYFYHTPTVIGQPMLYYIIACGHFYCDDKYYIERDNFGNHLLIYVVKGGVKIDCKVGSAVAKAGQLALFDCNKPHRYSAEGQTEFLFLHFEGANSITLCDYISKNFGIVFSLPNNSTLLEYLETMITESRTSAVATEIEHSKIIYTILCSIIQEIYVECPGDQGVDMIKQSIKFIRDNIGQSLTVQDIAEQANLSIFYFTRLFKKYIGYAPYEFVMHTKIDHAKFLLRTTNQSVKEIAYAVGYQTEHSFSVSFSHKVGISPLRFRNLKI